MKTQQTAYDVSLHEMKEREKEIVGNRERDEGGGSERKRERGERVCHCHDFVMSCLCNFF